MSMFVQLASFSSYSGEFDAKKDSRSINDTLRKLQDKGVKIVGISTSISRSSGANATAVYLITYEASEPIEI